MTLRAGLVSIMLALSAASPTLAGNVGTAAEAIAMVKRVQAKFKADGAEATFDAVTRQEPAFHDRDLYPFIYRLDGVNVAHGARPALVGKNLLNIKDPDGVPLIRQMVQVTTEKGSGWIDYKWPNPLNNKIEDKTSYCERMGDYFVGVGVYRPQKAQ
jgi:signal transduction histidine kinase